MRNLGLLKELVTEFLEGDINKDKFYKKARKRRKYAGYYKWMLSEDNIHLTKKRKGVIEKYQKAFNVLSDNDIIPKKVVDTLRDAALSLEKTDLAMAYNCMKLAKEFRPNGPLITSKLISYEKRLIKNNKEGNNE